MEPLKKIISFLSGLFKKERIIITFSFILFIFVVSIFYTCSELNNEKKERKNDLIIYQNNLRASQDSIKRYYDKKLEIFVNEKISYVVNDIKDLKNTNKQLYNDFKHVDKLITGIKSDIKVIIPTIVNEINDIKQDPNDSNKFTIPFNFKYSDNGLSQTISGNTMFRILNNKPQIPILSTLTENTFNVKLKYTYEEKDNKYFIKATSPSNLVQFTELDGVLILDKVNNKTTKSNRFVFGTSLNFGLNTNIIGLEPRLGWSIGVGGTYNIFYK